ncbi:C-X-C motif chemokine 11 isoform X1 [Esox lucius]|uniref:Chemokine interleukin-8-like domain-containing protein n=1 Tax=Esox lucius TaxID=8010 RepID=A0A3P8XIH2_ESOLU|nr:C-X-C motif chemokine 11 isoform X1 [Esox lucius]
MAFVPTVSSLLVVFLLGVCIQLDGVAAQYVPGARCICPGTIMHTSETIVDFEIIEKTFYCDKIEVIVTLEEDGAKRCLNPEGQKGRFFIQCWNKINKDGKQKKRCLKKKKE